jgi:hypothetical protein
MAELVGASDLGSGIERCVGSSPTVGTNKDNMEYIYDPSNFTLEMFKKALSDIEGDFKNRKRLYNFIGSGKVLKEMFPIDCADLDDNSCYFIEYDFGEETKSFKRRNKSKRKH